MSAAVAQARRWYWQRISAMVLVVCVVVHLCGLVYAVRGGLTATEILGRTHPTVYDMVVAVASGLAGAFALADRRVSPALPGVAIATAIVPVGLANIAREWWGLGEDAGLWLGRAFAVLLLVLGLRSVYAVVA